MLGDGIRMTHNGTGGAGTLSLTAISGWPTYDLVFGATNRFVRYEINQYSSSSKTVLVQRETGVGTYSTTGATLARTQIRSAWDGTTYLPNPSSATAPTALSFTNTAANVDIICGPSADMFLPSDSFWASTFASGITDGIGLPGLCVSSPSQILFSLVAGMVIYFPALITHNGPFTTASVRISAATTAGTTAGAGIYVSVYEINSSGYPGKRLADFGTLGRPTTATTTYSSAALSTPVDFGGGRRVFVGIAYFLGAGNDTGTPTIIGGLPISGTIGSYWQTGTSLYPSSPTLRLLSQTVMNDPATPPTSSNSGNGVQIPVVVFK